MESLQGYLLVLLLFHFGFLEIFFNNLNFIKMKKLFYYLTITIIFMQPTFVSAQKNKSGTTVKVLNEIDDLLKKSGIPYFENHKLFGISKESHELGDTKFLKSSKLIEKHFDLFWVPVWTYDIAVKTSYLDYDNGFKFKDDIIVLGNEFTASNSNFKLSFFQRYLGKLIALICLFVCLRISFSD